MATNKYFKIYGKKGNENEQALLQSLVNESIQIHGIDVKYIQRTDTIDTVMHEELETTFSNAKTIECYIENTTGFEGENAALQEWGLEVKEQVSIIFSQERFKNEIGLSRPMEGDLIYIPMINALFEIKYLDHDYQFYPLGKLPIYRCTCEKYELSSEDNFATGIPEIDAIDDVAQDTAGRNMQATQIPSSVGDDIITEIPNVIDQSQNRGKP